jgi:hypothetical protein
VFYPTFTKKPGFKDRKRSMELENNFGKKNEGGRWIK